VWFEPVGLRADFLDENEHAVGPRREVCRVVTAGAVLRESTRLGHDTASSEVLAEEARRSRFDVDEGRAP
jgi:hypothetical protein